MQGREQQVAGEGGLDRNLDRFLVPDLAHEDHFRVLAQEGTQDRVEGKADLLVGLCLAYTLEIIFDRILGRHDVQFGIIDMLKTAIERSRLSRSCGAGDQHHSLWRGDRIKDVVVIHF